MPPADMGWYNWKPELNFKPSQLRISLTQPNSKTVFSPLPFKPLLVATSVASKSSACSNIIQLRVV